MTNDSTTPRTVGDVIADLRDMAVGDEFDGHQHSAGLLREAADVLEQMVPSSALLPDQVSS